MKKARTSINFLACLVVCACSGGADESGSERTAAAPCATSCLDHEEPPADAGSDAPAYAPDAAHVLDACEVDCDCNDDNVCTTDACVGGVCERSPKDGGCGSTVGTCRGTWCCTGETACFQAFDNESECP